MIDGTSGLIVVELCRPSMMRVDDVAISTGDCPVFVGVAVAAGIDDADDETHVEFA